MLVRSTLADHFEALLSQLTLSNCRHMRPVFDWLFTNLLTNKRVRNNRIRCAACKTKPTKDLKYEVAS